MIFVDGVATLLQPDGMSVHTDFQVLNENDPAFVKAKNGTSQEIEAWEDDNGPIKWRPGGKCAEDWDGVEETDEEYGGWIIKLSDIPKDATHIVVSRG